MTSKARLAKATDYEKVTARIYALLSPESTVVHNDKIHGRDSGKSRQIDVSIRSQIAGHEILVIVQCKDYKSKVNVDRVGEFHSVIKDVGAHRGVLVTSVGFSDGAKSYAKNNGIDLCHVHDAETLNWKRIIQVPVIVEKVVPSINVSFKTKLEKGMTFKDEAPFIISDVDVLESFSGKWNTNKFDVTLDSFKFDLEVAELFFRDIHNNPVPIMELDLNIRLSRQLFWAYFSDLPKSKAIENVSTNRMEFILAENDFNDDSLNMHFLKDIGSLPIKSDLVLKILSTPSLMWNSKGMKANFVKIS